MTIFQDLIFSLLLPLIQKGEIVWLYVKKLSHLSCGSLQLLSSFFSDYCTSYLVILGGRLVFIKNGCLELCILFYNITQHSNSFQIYLTKISALSLKCYALLSYTLKFVDLMRRPMKTCWGELKILQTTASLGHF